VSVYATTLASSQNGNRFFSDWRELHAVSSSGPFDRSICSGVQVFLQVSCMLHPARYDCPRFRLPRQSFHHCCGL